MPDRPIAPQSRDEDTALDRALRPTLLAEFPGQERLKENLGILIEAAKLRHESLEHVLFYGPPGLGKTSLAHIVANEMGGTLHITAGPIITIPGDLAAILSSLKQGDVLFIDEIHRLSRPVEEILYPAMEDFALDLMIGKGPSARNIRLKLPHFTVIGATTRLALVSSPLRARFGAVYRLDYYEQHVLEQIIARGAKLLEVQIDPSGLDEVARRGRGTPRVALRLLRRVRDYAQVKADGMITAEVAREALRLLEIDDLGLDTLDRQVLARLIRDFRGGPVGLETIAASLSEEPDTIMDVVEPYLLQLGFLDRTPRGRVATRRAYEHLGEPYPEALEQASLFPREPDGPTGQPPAAA